MAIKSTLVPNDRAPLGAAGEIKTSWVAFFTSLQKIPEPVSPDIAAISPAATLGQAVAAINLLIADNAKLKKLLRDNNLMET